MAISGLPHPANVLGVRQLPRVPGSSGKTFRFSRWSSGGEEIFSDLRLEHDWAAVRHDLETVGGQEFDPLAHLRTACSPSASYLACVRAPGRLLRVTEDHRCALMTLPGTKHSTR